MRKNKRYVRTTAYNIDWFEETVNKCDEILKSDQNVFWAWNEKGEALEYVEQYDEAIICYNKAIKLVPEAIEVRINKGNALILSGLFEDAIICFNEVIKLNPESYRVGYNKWCECGKMFYFEKQYEEAVICFENALKLIPNESTILEYKEAALKQINLQENK